HQTCGCRTNGPIQILHGQLPALRRACDKLKSPMQPKKNLVEMEAIAKKLRREIVEMIGEAKSGHPGGSLSAVEVLVTLYFDVMRHDPSNPKWPDRDRFI